MKGDSKRQGKLITLKFVLNQIQMEIWQEIERRASNIRACHEWDLLADVLSEFWKQKKILEQTTGFCREEKEVRAVAPCYKVRENNEVCIKGSEKVDQAFWKDMTFREAQIHFPFKFTGSSVALSVSLVYLSITVICQLLFDRFWQRCHVANPKCSLIVFWGTLMHTCSHYYYFFCLTFSSWVGDGGSCSQHDWRISYSSLSLREVNRNYMTLPFAELYCMLIESQAA